jgi:hypothetical protein
MSTQTARAHEILEANFDGMSTDEQRLELARIAANHPEMVESLVKEVFIHGLLQWENERIPWAMAPPNQAFVANDPPSR